MNYCDILEIRVVSACLIYVTVFFLNIDEQEVIHFEKLMTGKNLTGPHLKNFCVNYTIHIKCPLSKADWSNNTHIQSH